MFESPNYVCVSTDGSRIYVSDKGTDTVTCLSEDGRIIYQSREVVVSPRGVCVGPGGYLAVCGSSSDHVVLLDDRGQVLSELVTSSDGVENPQCVTYRSSDGRWCTRGGDEPGIESVLVGIIYSVFYKYPRMVYSWWGWNGD